MDKRQTIGWNLRSLRVAKGLSQEKLALESNIDRSYVGRVERGRENATVATLEAFARVLAVNVGVLNEEIESTENKPAALRSGRKRRADFNDLAEIHHCYAMAETLNYNHIMRDEQEGEIKVLLQVEH